MLTSPLSKIQLAAICVEFDEDLRGLVAARSSGQIDETDFVRALLELEAVTAARNGLTLTASHTYDDWTVVSLRVARRSQPCASFEFQPSTGCFRAVGCPCRD